MKAPDIAENGAVVPVDVSSNIPNTISIAILATRTPSRCQRSSNFANGAVADASRAPQDGPDLHRPCRGQEPTASSTAPSKEVKVTVGGCGG